MRVHQSVRSGLKPSKEVEQDQGIYKDGEISKKFKWHVEKMYQLEEFCDVTLASDDYDRIRAHKVVLASASTIFRDLFQSDDENTEY